MSATRQQQLAGLPDIGRLCAEGEQAFADNEYEEAVAWYELACAGTYRVSTGYEDLVAKRFEHYAELRKMVPWRSVQRLLRRDAGHQIAVMTCVGREHLRDRLAASLNQAGFGRWNGTVYPVVDDSRRGQAWTFFECLRRAASDPAMTYLTLLEDDIVLAKNALDYIATTRIDDDLAFISWFSREACSIPRVLPVLSCRPALHYDCNQAITFPARTVHELLASDVLKNWSEKHGADRIYGMVFPDRPVAVHYPNLVQHVGGLESLVGNNEQGARVSPSFIGEDADALGLVR